MAHKLEYGGTGLPVFFFSFPACCQSQPVDRYRSIHRFPRLLTSNGAYASGRCKLIIKGHTGEPVPPYRSMQQLVDRQLAGVAIVGEWLPRDQLHHEVRPAVLVGQGVMNLGDDGMIHHCFHSSISRPRIHHPATRRPAKKET